MSSWAGARSGAREEVVLRGLQGGWEGTGLPSGLLLLLRPPELLVSSLVASCMELSNLSLLLGPRVQDNGSRDPVGSPYHEKGEVGLAWCGDSGAV